MLEKMTVVTQHLKKIEMGQKENTAHMMIERKDDSSNSKLDKIRGRSKEKVYLYDDDRFGSGIERVHTILENDESRKRNCNRIYVSIF